MYLNPETLSNQSNYVPGLIKLTPEQEQIYIQHNGFVIITEDEKSETGYSITADIEKWEEWKSEQPDPVEEARKVKIQEISDACKMAINTGTNVQFSNGESEFFTYDLADQSNIAEMFNAVLLGATGYPFHASNGGCKLYNAQDIVTIYSTLSTFKTGHTTYHNQLKQYVNSLTTMEDIDEIVYGQPLAGNYLDNYNELMEQAKVQLNNVLNNIQSISSLSKE